MREISSQIEAFIGNVPRIVPGVTKDWRICKEEGGAVQDLDWKLELDRLISHFRPNTNVPVDVDSPGHKRTMIELSEVVTRLRRGEKGLYVKDWHLESKYDDSLLYEVPLDFEDDWLNWHWRVFCRGTDDFCFLYLGSEDTCTFVHHDVSMSYSWSVNLFGRKRWTLWPPSQTPLLFPPGQDISSSEPVRDPRPGHYDSETFPGLFTACPIVLVQGVGDALFVPSGWYHFVENLGPCTASINRNWINGFSIYESWKFQLRELQAVRAELWHLLDGSDDPRLCMGEDEWIQQCNDILRANSSMSLLHLIEMIAGRILFFQSSSSDSKCAEEQLSTTWQHVLCARYDPTQLSESDRKCAARSCSEPCVELRSLLPAAGECHYGEWPSLAQSFHGGDAPWSLCPKPMSLAEAFTLQGLAAESVTNVGVFSAAQVIRIANEMLSSVPFLRHLSAALECDTELVNEALKGLIASCVKLRH
jgi:hypothetical protein